jgi:hypothetical protein
MLRGLPRSNKLGWWFTHSGRFSPCSSSSGTSCAWISYGSILAYSSWTATCNSSYDPVWCNYINKYANSASDAVARDDHDGMICRWTHWDFIGWKICKIFLQGSQHHPRTVTTNTCHLLYSFLPLTPVTFPQTTI